MGLVEEALKDARELLGLHVRESELAEMLARSLSFAVAATETDATAQLTAAERRILEAGGAELAPLGRADRKFLLSSAVQEATVLASSLTVADAARRLRIDPSRVRHQLADRTLYGIKVRGEWRLPAFQFGRRGAVPGIDVVLKAMPPDLHPLDVLGFLTFPVPELEIGGDPVSPMEWLRRGGPPEVAADLARELGAGI